MAETDRRGVLETFRRCLVQEAHVVAADPGLLWQQLHNRLQWYPDEVAELLEEGVARRHGAGGPPWILLRTPFRESG
ncbi:MAG: hypothetical protein JW990_10605, partial [Thermoleophilia bacterium]|nr:hypothetical protein [Thermoleophilia bacterium]